MLQQIAPDDYVFATGTQYSVWQFIFWSAQELGVILRFEGGRRCYAYRSSLFQACRGGNVVG
jgi:GDP-D-mannose dehydratase